MKKPNVRLAVMMMAVFAGSAAYADDGMLGVPLHGFADAGWGRATSGQIARERDRGFVLGTVDLYLNPQFSDHVRALVEVALEPSFNEEAESLDVERLQVGYSFSDLLTAWVGRFHTPYGYWNTAYHHGAEIQPSIYKPRFLDWEDHAGFMPSHSTGLWLTGKTDLGAGQFQYDFWIANGNRILTPTPTPISNPPGGTLDMNIMRDDNFSSAYGGRLTYRFGDALDGLALGVHALTDEVDTYDSTVNPFNQTSQSVLRMYGGYLVYEAHNFEISSEVYRFSDYDPSVGSDTSYGSWAGFAHVGYYIIPDMSIYGRVERAKTNQSDNYFSNQINGFSYDREVLGARYNINARSCVKLEVNHTTVHDSTVAAAQSAGAFNEVRTQYAIAF